MKIIGMPSSRLVDELTTKALGETDHPASAVTALMCAAATILQRDFGTEAAAQLMVEMVVEAQHDLLARGLVAQPTEH